MRGLFNHYILGDFAKIGEKHLHLSDSVKQRIALARALYSDADIYLIDNIWESFNVKLGGKIWERAVLQFLKNKTRIIVTNDLTTLHQMDNILYLKAGAIKLEGTIEKIRIENEY